MTTIVLHQAFERVLERDRPDPDQPHSSTAPRAVWAPIRKGWCTVRDDTGRLRVVVTTSLRRARILGQNLPATMIAGLRGGLLRDVIDLPGLDGSLPIVASARGGAGDGATEHDIFLRVPWFMVETAGPMVDVASDLVRIVKRGRSTT